MSRVCISCGSDYHKPHNKGCIRYVPPSRADLLEIENKNAAKYMVELSASLNGVVVENLQLRKDADLDYNTIRKYISTNEDLNIDNLMLRKALRGLCDAYLVHDEEGKPLKIKVIKIGLSDFNKAFDAFEFARKVLNETE